MLPLSVGLFADYPVDRLAQQVRVTRVTRGLLDEVEENPAQRPVARRARNDRELIEGNTGDPGSTAITRGLVERAQLLRSVIDGAVKVPVCVRIERGARPRFDFGQPEETALDLGVFDQGEMLEQAPQGESRRCVRLT